MRDSPEVAIRRRVVYLVEEGVWEDRNKVKIYVSKLRADMVFNRIRLPLVQESDGMKKKKDSGMPSSGRWATITEVELI